MTFLLAKVIEIALPPLVQFVVWHYERREERTDVEQSQLDAHKQVLAVLKGNK